MRSSDWSSDVCSSDLWLTSVPTMLALILQEKELLTSLDLSSVKVVAMGSAPATQALIDSIRQTFPGARIAYGYGTTEAGPTSFGPHPAGTTGRAPGRDSAGQYV